MRPARGAGRSAAPSSEYTAAFRRVLAVFLDTSRVNALGEDVSLSVLVSEANALLADRGYAGRRQVSSPDDGSMQTWSGWP